MKSFKDLGVKELRRAATEDFAVEIPDNANAKEIIAAFTEIGLTWSDYAAQHPEVVEVVESNDSSSVVTSSDVTGHETVVAPAKVRTAEPVIRAQEDKYLLKMTRENTLYETRGYKFTQEHPYALVSASDADYILSKEDGFRQAFPSELEDFYG